MKTPPIDRFWSLLSRYKSEIRQIYIYALFIGLVNLSLPVGIQAIINFIYSGELTSSWVILVIIVLAGIAVTGVLQVFQLKIVETIQQDVFARFAFDFAYRIPKITLLQLDKIHAPELVNRFFDVLTIQKGLPKILIDFSLAIFQIFFGLILLTIYSSYFIILGVALIVILWIAFKITGEKGLSTSIKESKNKYQLVHWLEEVARVNSSFKLHAEHKLHLNKTDNITEKYLSNRESHFKVLINQFKFFVGFKILIEGWLLILGGYLVIQGQMDIGQFVAAEIIIILIIYSVEKVMVTIEMIYDVLTALDKIGYVTDLKLDKNIGHTEVDNTSAFSLKGVEIQFGFPNIRKKVFNNFSFEIAKKSKVLLKGDAGSGKSVFLQIIAGIYPIEDGALYVNEIPFINYNKNSLFENIGVCFRDNQIFEGTFRENITVGRDVYEKELLEVVKLLKLDSFFLHQPEGIDCFVESEGKRLSRGTIQKLLIARVIINKPKLLLLENSLQFLKEYEKNRIIDYIMDDKHDWTVVVISDHHYWEKRCTQTIDLSNSNN